MSATTPNHLARNRAYDDLHRNLIQAKALAAITWGSGENFREMSEDIQEAYMWALSGRLEAAERVLKRLGTVLQEGDAA